MAKSKRRVGSLEKMFDWCEDKLTTCARTKKKVQKRIKRIRKSI